MANQRILSVSARAFVSASNTNKPNVARGTWKDIAQTLDKKGGNPVTIFYPLDHTNGKSTSKPVLTPNERSALAKTCAWESVIIEPNGDSDAHNFRFFMPSGEEVSFCGHAAIGASAFVANKQLLVKADDLSSVKFDSTKLTVPFVTADNSRYDSRVSGNEVELVMHVSHEEVDCRQISNGASLGEILHVLGIDSNDLSPNNNLPSFINSSVARPKTLIPIKTVNRLNAATPPDDPITFQSLCDSIESTGIYLYSQAESADGKVDDLFECRQFPRASGYSEDPATGIAAGALAASLHMRGGKTDWYSCNQGSSMGRPSNIQVRIENYCDGIAKLSYVGLVVFDSISLLE